MNSKIDMDELKEEQRKIIEKYKKNDLLCSIVIRQLIVMVLVSFIAIINPINLENKIELSLLLLGTSVFFIIISYIFIFISFKNKRYKLLKCLYILINIFFGIMLKALFYKMNLNQFFIGTITVVLYLTVLSIIVMRIKKLAMPAFLMIIAIIYLVFKYVNLKDIYIFTFILNSFTYCINLNSVATRINDNTYGKADIIVTQSVLTFLFVAEIFCISILLKI